MAAINSKTRMLLIIAVVFAVNALLIWTAFAKKVQLPEKKVDWSAAADDDGGTPIQRSRIDRFIEQVGQYPDIDSLCHGLNDDVLGGDNIVAIAAGYSDDLRPQTEFLCVIADRRVARLFGMLSSMNQAEAERLAVELFQLKLELYCADQHGVLNDRLDGDGKVTPVPIANNYHALASAGFLCAAFANGEQLVKCFDVWRTRVDEILSRLSENEEELGRCRMEFTTYGAPQNLFMINCFVLFLERNGCIEHDELKSVLPERGICEFNQEPYLSWEAKTAPYDFTHLHRFVPIDRSKILFELSVAHNWGRLQGMDAYQSMVVGHFRKRVLNCAKK